MRRKQQHRVVTERDNSLRMQNIIRRVKVSREREED